MIYKLTKTQLITIWIFAILYWFIELDSVNASNLAILGLPCILIVYTIGWKKFKDSNTKK